ncbi:MAG TPA: hypothetical protein VF008_28625 [Niastella sp.]
MLLFSPILNNGYSKNILAFITLFTFLCCNRIKNKGEAIVDKTKQTISKTKQKIVDKKNRLIDQVFPIYNSDTCDTESNKKRFREHLQIGLPGDVTHIYAYGDFLGADYKVLIAFTCDQATINNIIATKEMEKSTQEFDNGLNFLDEFTWWHKDKIEKLAPYKVGREMAYWKYLWYDPTSKQAYYEEFSM